MQLKTTLIALASLAVATLTLVGCGPAKSEKNTPVSANEVGYQFSLEGDTVGNQQVMNPTEYAAEKRVQSRTIVHGQRAKYHGYGWQWWAYEWIPTDAVAKASLLPVTREWTQVSKTGTGTHDQSFQVESLNSIGCSLGASTQVRLIPDQTHLYLSRYGGKPLDEVADTVVWGYMVGRATYYFGQINIEEAPLHLNDYATNIHNDAKKYFAQYGIDVATFGWVGGIRYDRGDIQTKLDEVFVAENDLVVAGQEQQRQRQQNAIHLQHAQAERTQALALWNNRNGAVLRTNLDLREAAITADTNLINKWNGVSSQLIPSDRGVLWFLGQTGLEVQMDAIAKIADTKNPELDKLAAEVAAQLKKESDARIEADKGDPVIPAPSTQPK